MGNWFVWVALFGWIPAIIALFATLSSRRAVITAFLMAWLFLPMAEFKLAPGIPVFDKMSATCVGVILASFVFDTRRLVSFRPTWIDLPMLVWCLCPMASSLTNNLGPYDGAASMLRQVVVWGLPYFIGRVYFTDLASLKELAIGLFIGGVIYVPLCLFEIRMSPQLHLWVYGYVQHSWLQTFRFGGWRPMVFMAQGLMVGMWMCMTGLIGLWLWHAGVVRNLRRVPMIYLVIVLLVTAVLCKSVGAIVFLVLGAAALFITHRLQLRVLVWVLVAVAPVYMVVRAGGIWDGMELVQISSNTVGLDRSDSLAFRLRNENMLVAKAMQRPIWGWGGWDRNRVYDEEGTDLTVTDGLWICELGTYGVVGLAAWTLAMLLPASLVLSRYPNSKWRDPRIAPAVVLAMVVVLYVVDCLPNAMVNPIFMLCVGGLASLAVQPIVSSVSENWGRNNDTTLVPGIRVQTR